MTYKWPNSSFFNFQENANQENCRQCSCIIFLIDKFELDEKKIYRLTKFFHKLDNNKCKCTRAHVQENKSIYLSIYLSIWKPFWKRVYIYIYIWFVIRNSIILPMFFIPYFVLPGHCFASADIFQCNRPSLLWRSTSAISWVKISQRNFLIIFRSLWS